MTHAAHTFDGIALASYLQPIFSLPHQRAVGYEALLRGIAPSAPPIEPFDLFGKAIVEGSVALLDRTSHATHLASAATRLPAATWLFLNINPSTFTDAAYAAELAALARACGLAPERIVIEVLESGGTELARIAQATHAFRSQGFLVAVDDFGAGHSNIDRLLTLRPDIVKLDRSLVRTQAAHLRDALLPKLVGLLHESGMFVVAEGIETEQDLLLAARSNVDFVQGYLFGRPAPELVQTASAAMLFETVFDTLTQMRHAERLASDLLLTPYRSQLEDAIARLSDGASTEAACAALLALPCTSNCFFLDQRGRAFSPALPGAAARPAGERFAPIADPSTGRWDNRAYFADALASREQLIASAPYLSVTGASLCVTLTVAVRYRGAWIVVGTDIDWQKLSTQAAAIL
ncbi:EAL domain-containing protein [Caballeronia telluris]|uniref:EAL domain-containing protein n=1 Tax=Caballeronia telluris TaxID=326475 RepID=A0A158IRV3_9BURK|nr:EAL domain-containing protein [Caballeronia telluris]SAL57456.1 EAL domain-containing protein [Caballeronia telluris]SAL58899.1 EAL domain-containing protein [Caballeronia telluris]